MARANGIPAHDVYEFDASRQSNRVSANVSGFAGTLRISLNDNLLKRCTLPEIETTMGHEMGHYVLNHAYKGLVMLGVIIVIGFAFVNWGIKFGLVRWGEQWQVRGISDVAVLPLAVIVFSLYFFLVTPVTNTISRNMEYEADMYGLNAARQPDGEANVDMLLGEYRKLDPGPHRGVHLLRSSQRTHPHHRCHALEGRASAVSQCRRNGAPTLQQQVRTEGRPSPIHRLFSLSS